MRVFLTGVSCIGKTTIGAKLAALLGYSFSDLDEEIERLFGTSIERLQNRFLTMHSYREEASKVLIQIVTGANTEDSIIALPPSGLMGGFWRVVKKAKGTVIVLTDDPENILQRIIFYDIDSRPIHKHLTEKEKRLYLREIKKDITYFRKTYGRADAEVNISGLTPDMAAVRVKEILGQFLSREHVPLITEVRTSGST
jgi:shikimate kinase